MRECWTVDGVKPAYDPRTSCWCCGWDHVLGLTPCGPTSGVPVGILTHQAPPPATTENQA